MKRLTLIKRLDINSKFLLLGSFMLLIAMLPIPGDYYFYYQVLKIVVMGITIAIIMQEKDFGRKNGFWAISSIVIFFIFLAGRHERSFWILIDFIVAVFFMIRFFKFKKLSD